MIIIDQKINCKKITGKAFRLVFDDKHIIVLIDGTNESKTWTKHRIEEFVTKQEAFNKINVLGLMYNDWEYNDRENKKGKN